jgi:probable phosphoglycerate mutase
MNPPRKSSSPSAGLFSEPVAGASARGVVVANIDGGARGNPGPAAYGIVLHDAGGATLFSAGKRIGRATNNVAEYFGLIAALDAARERGIGRLRVESDSELLVRQMQGHYRVKSPDLKPLHERALKLSRGFDFFEIAHVPREKNREADRLVNAALDGEPGAPSREEQKAPARTIRARYIRGVLVPEDPLDLADGADVTVTVRIAAPRRE